MTPEDLELLRQLYEHPEPWTVKRSDDGKYLIGTFRVDIATADEKQSADMIAKMRNRIKELIEENAVLRSQCPNPIRGPVFPDPQ